MKHTVLMQKIRRMTPVGVGHIVASYKNGESANSIARRMGLSDTGIRKWLRKRGVDLRHQPVYTKDQKLAPNRKRKKRNSAELDHLNGTENRSVCGATLYGRLRMAGWPKKDELRVLCFNCNCGRHYNNGVCPHRR